MPAQVCRWISPYDLRHSRLTSLGATGNLPGVMFLAGCGMTYSRLEVPAETSASARNSA